MARSPSPNMRVLGLVASVAAIGLASCTSPGANAAVVIDDVPYDLTGTVVTTLPPITQPEGPFVLKLYFISELDESLLSVERNREQRPGLQDAIDALIAGPSAEEQAIVPMRSRLSEALNLRASAPTDGLVAITVSDEALFRDNPNRLPAQVLVCTLTEFPGIDAVQLRDSVGPIPLAGANSESIEAQFATKGDYENCAATAATDLAPASDQDDGSNPPDTDTNTGPKADGGE